MSTRATAKLTSRIGATASILLAPVSVIWTLYLLACIGSLFGQIWAMTLLWSLTIFVSALTMAVLAGSPPLPRLADQNHLLHRLSWLGRYGTATFLLCISTFLGGVAATAVPAVSAQQTTDALSSLVGIVGLYATQAAIVLFLIWLAIDVKRIGADGRRSAFVRSIAYLAGGRAAEAFNRPVIMRWLITFTSPILVSLAAATVIISMLMQINGRVP